MNWVEDCYIGSTRQAVDDYYKYFGAELRVKDWNEEFLCTSHGYIGKSVMIVGGGPSTKLVDWQTISVDTTWATNHFFHTYPNYRFDVLALMPEVKFNNPKLLHYINTYRPMLALEINNQWNRPKRRDSIPKKAVNSFFYYTRFYGRMGVVARLCILAHHLGVEKIYHVGFDGPMAIFNKDHSFQEGKDNIPGIFLRNCNSEEEIIDAYKTQYLEFLSYTRHMNIINLGRSYEYNIENII